MNNPSYLDKTKPLPPSLWVLVLLISFGTVSAVLITPALPEMSQYFGVSHSAVQWTLSLFLLGYAVGQLPYGPLANRFGRVNAVKIGALMQIVGGLFCITAFMFHLFTLLLLGRFIMALGASVGLTIGFTLINDFYKQETARQISSKMVTAFAILPGLSLFAGGIMTDYCQWQYCFYFLLLYGFVMYWVANHFIDEPVRQQSEKNDWQQVVKSYQKALTQKELLLYAALWGLSTAVIYIFNAMSPFIGINKLQLSESVFGLLAAIPPMGILIGSLITQRLNMHFSAIKVISMGVVSSVLFCALMLLGFVSNLTTVKLFGFSFLVNVCLTLVVSNASVLASRGAKDGATASSVVSFLNMAIGGLGVYCVQFLPQNWVGSLPSALTLVTVIMLALISIPILSRLTSRQGVTLRQTS